MTLQGGCRCRGGSVASDLTTSLRKGSGRSVARLCRRLLLILILHSTLGAATALAACEDTTAYTLGSVVAVGGSCAGGTGSLPGTTCRLLEIRCPGLDSIRVQVRITPPTSGVPERGTVVFSSGASGTGFYGDQDATLLMQDLVAMGFRVVDRAWLGTLGWTTREAGLRRESCRYATLLTWVHDSVHVVGALCATGNSGGSAEVGYALTTWGRGDILDLAVPTSGPAVARLDYACKSIASAEWSALCQSIVPPGSMSSQPPCLLSPSNGVCRQCGDTPTDEELRLDSVAHDDADLHYPGTRMHFIYGADDTLGPSVPIGLTWSANVTSTKTIEFVPATPHVLTQTAQGREAIRLAIDLGTSSPVGVAPSSRAGSPFRLDPNRPNPFRRATTVRFTLDSPMHVRITVHDVAGRRIRTLLDDHRLAGEHSIPFEPGVAAAGFYFCRMTTSQGVQVRPMVLLGE